MPATLTIERNMDHPWTQEDGYDHGHVVGDTREEVEALCAKARAKFWHKWPGHQMRNGKPYQMLYKPHGITHEWTDY